MLAPMRPRPIIPSCITLLLLIGYNQLVETSNLGHSSPGGKFQVGRLLALPNARRGASAIRVRSLASSGAGRGLAIWHLRPGAIEQSRHPPIGKSNSRTPTARL